MKFNLEQVQANIPGKNNETRRYFMVEALRKQELKHICKQEMKNECVHV